MKRIGVVECGLMGAGIAEVAGIAGLEVVMVESHETSASRGRSQLAASLKRSEERGRCSSADEVLERVHNETQLEALAEVELVVEAATENEAIKFDLFRQLDQIVTAPGAIIASNTSSIPIVKLGTVTDRRKSGHGFYQYEPVGSRS